MHRNRLALPTLATAVLGLGFNLACVEKASKAPSQKQLQTIKENILTEVPPLKRTVNADLDGKITYLGCDYDKESLAPGEAMVIKHYFKVVQAPGRGWKLFQHLNGDSPESNWVNIDHKPVKGTYDVGDWKTGEIIRDEYKLTLPKNFSAPMFTVHLGIYKGPDRLRVVTGEQDGKNRVVALKLPVTNAAAPPPLPDFIVRRTSKPLKIDGKLDEAEWKSAVSSGPLKDSLKGEKVVDPSAEVKLLWDDKYLYAAFTASDEGVFSDLKAHDDKLWTQDVFELFLDADGDQRTYVELQVNPNNATFDSYLPERRKNQNEWTANLVTAVSIDGTIEKRDDTDKGWTAEVAVPWSAVAGMLDSKALGLPPSPGKKIRGNFFRFDLRKDGKMVAAAWSPTLEPDFHNTPRFGRLIFATEEGSVPAEAPLTAPALQPAVGGVLTPSTARELIGKPGLVPPVAPGSTQVKPAAPAGKKKGGK